MEDLLSFCSFSASISSSEESRFTLVSPFRGIQGNFTGFCGEVNREASREQMSDVFLLQSQAVSVAVSVSLLLRIIIPRQSLVVETLVRKSSSIINDPSLRMACSFSSNVSCSSTEFSHRNNKPIKIVKMG